VNEGQGIDMLDEQGQVAFLGKSVKHCPGVVIPPPTDDYRRCNASAFFNAFQKKLIYIQDLFSQ
jgi:hypothetical protein